MEIILDKNDVKLDKDKFYQVLDSDGNLLDANFVSSFSKEELLKAYNFMVLSRQQDTYMSQLQRQGRMLTFAPNFGEEGLQVASALPLTKDDWFVPAFRSNAAMLLLGVPVLNQIYYWNGNEKGSKMPEGVNVLPINVPIATQYSHATGVAYGMKLRNTKDVAVTFIGDGGTAEGESYEAMNIASIRKLPVVFCINNNQWAISTPTRLESGSETYAAKAAATGMPALRVDGNDVLASAEVMKKAVEYAREGNGPVLVEFITWRQGPHTTSDNPRVYRTAEEENEKEKAEPFHRIEKYLMDQNFISQSDIEKLKEDKLELVKSEYQKSLNDLDTSIDEIFDHTYFELTDNLKEQKKMVEEYYKNKGSE